MLQSLEFALCRHLGFSGPEVTKFAEESGTGERLCSFTTILINGCHGNVTWRSKSAMDKSITRINVHFTLNWAIRYKINKKLFSDTINQVRRFFLLSLHTIRLHFETSYSAQFCTVILEVRFTETRYSGNVLLLNIIHWTPSVQDESSTFFTILQKISNSKVAFKVKNVFYAIVGTGTGVYVRYRPRNMWHKNINFNFMGT